MIRQWFELSPWCQLKPAINACIMVYLFEHHIHSTSSSLIHWSRTNKFLSKCLNLLIITHIQIIIYKGWNLKIFKNLMSNDNVIFSLSFWLIYNKSNLEHPEHSKHTDLLNTYSCNSVLHIPIHIVV